MALKYGFFNSVDGDRMYNAEDLGRYLHGIVSSGVYADRSDSLQVVANGDLTVTVQPGRAMLDCHYLENDDPLTLTLSAGDTQDRIDAIVMRLDLAERTCSIYVKKGTPATTPARPSVARLDNTKEWMLASVYVGRLAAALTQSNITDTRSDQSVCGWVTGVIDQVDTSTLFAQMEAALQEKSAQFDAWMADLASAVPFAESDDYPGSLCRIQDGEIEWLNPPLVNGVEYRTAERYNGVPVYVYTAQYNGTFSHPSLGAGTEDAVEMRQEGFPVFRCLFSIDGYIYNGDPAKPGWTAPLSTFPYIDYVWFEPNAEGTASTLNFRLHKELPNNYGMFLTIKYTK